MKKLFTSTGLIFACLFLFVGNIYSQIGQTNPTPYILSNGNYSFTQWDNTNPALTYPANMIFHTTTMLDAPIDANFDADWTAEYNLTSSARFEGAGTNGIAMVNTSTTNSGQGFVGEVVLALDATNRTQIEVGWTGAFMDIEGSTSRVYAIRLQYRIGETGNWNDVYDGLGNIEEYNFSDYTMTGALTPPDVKVFNPITLPSEVDNQPVVQLRWVYFQKVSGSGYRPRLRVDEISVMSESLIGTPTQLTATSIIPAEQLQNIPAYITLRSTDANGVPKFVNSNTTIKATLTSGNGQLTGTTVKTMLAGTNYITFDDLIYNQLGDAQITFTATYGDALAPLAVNLRYYPAPTSAVFNELYGKGNVGLIHHPFSVKILNADGTVNSRYSNIPITFKMISGPAPIGGTLTKNAVNGIAIFDDINFTMAGQYFVSATAPGLPDPMQVQIDIKAIPIFGEVIVPDYISTPLSSTNETIPSYALIKFTGLNENTEYTFTTSGILPSEISDPAITGAGNNIYYDYSTDSYNYTSSSPNLRDPLNRSVFKTGPGETTKSIWINLVPTPDSRFAVGNSVNWCVYLANAYGDLISRNVSTKVSSCIQFGTETDEATGIYDVTSRLAPKNFLVYYDFVGNLISTAIVQDDGATLGFPSQIPAYYENIDGINSAWGTFLPNNLPDGLAKIEEYSPNGNLLYTWSDEDGIWGAVDTRNPNGGSSNAIYFETPYVAFTNLNNYSELCNFGQVDITFDYHGVALLSIDVSSDGGSTWLPVASEIDPSEGHYLWTVQRETYSGVPLSFRIYSTEHPYMMQQIDGVVIFDVPEIIQQTQSDVYCIDSEVSIGVVATGTQLQYQWYRDGVLIPGATLSYYYFPSIKYDNSAIYTCVISNPSNGYGEERCQSVTTEDIVVYVARPTTIAKQPETMYINIGGSAYFEVDPAANGIPPSYTFTYQWFVNGAPVVNSNRIQGASSRKLYFKTVSSSDLNKQYVCRVSALCGVAYSDTVQLSQSEISFSTQPQDKSVCEGTDITLTTVVKNTNNLTLKYYWMKGNYRLSDNIHISGSQTPELTIFNTNAGDIGNYYLVVEVVDKGYKIFSTTAAVWVTTQPVIISQSPASVSVNLGQKLELFVNVESTTDNLTYEWSKDGAVLSNQISDKLVIDIVAAEDGGTYVCKIKNDCGEVISSPILVGIVTPGITGVNDFCDCEFEILSPRPNPTSGVSDIQINLAKSFTVSLDMTNVLGQIVYSREASTYGAGLNHFEIDFTTLNLNDGVYFVNIRTENKVFTKKIVFMK